MRYKGFVLSLLLVAIAAGPVLAEEVIHFTNGTVMPIRSHKIEGDTIKVDLGDNGFMAFPKSVVEKIEEAPDVMLMPSTANQMFAGSGTSNRVYGASPRQSATSWQLPTQGDTTSDPGATQSISGVLSAAPMSTDEHPMLRQIRVNAVPEKMGIPDDAQVVPPGTPQTLPNPKIKKKSLTEFKSRD